MAMNLKDFVAGALGDIPNELAHSMSQVFHDKLMQCFEDTDDPEVKKLKGLKIELKDGEPPVNVYDIVRRVLSMMMPKELEFEIETPCHFSGDTDGDGDIEISLKKTGLFKERSYIKIRVLMEKAELPESLELLRDHVNLGLHKQLD